MPTIIFQHLIFWEVFVIFLLVQSFFHGFRWRKNDYIELKEKRIWSIVRFVIYALNAFLFIFYLQDREGWEFAFEVIRFTFLQLVLFWIFFDILLPWIAKKPQLWNDPNLNDNNSPFDRIGGSWIGNFTFKGISLLIVWFWFSSTSPEEFVPLFPNWAALLAFGLVVVASIFIGIYQQLTNKSL